MKLWFEQLSYTVCIKGIYAWRLYYLRSKARRQVEALRKFTGNHLTDYPISMVTAALQTGISDLNEQLFIIGTAKTFDEFLKLDSERVLRKILDQADKFMQEANDFLTSVGEIK
jgi:hypothetical protein